MPSQHQNKAKHCLHRSWPRCAVRCEQHGHWGIT
jgi:hypothetical protein